MVVFVCSVVTDLQQIRQMFGMAKDEIFVIISTFPMRCAVGYGLVVSSIHRVNISILQKSVNT